MNILMLLNPFAGHKRAGSVRTAILDAFARKNMGVECLETQHPWHGMDLLAEADLGNYDGVVAAGGDGTLFETINGYMRNTGPEKPPLGVIPIGTGNAFAKDLGLESFEWQKAIDLIAKGNVREVDIAQFQTEGRTYYFMNILGLGFVSDVNATSKYVKFLGNGAYTAGVFWELLKMKTFPLRLELDGEIIERDNFFVEIANTRYTGSTFKIAPEAEIDDGLLDVILLNKTSRMRVLKLFPTIYEGRHVEHPEVEMFKARSIKVVTPMPKPLTPDGEQMGSTPIEVSCLERAIRMFR